MVRFGDAFGVLASEFRRRASAVFAVALGPFVRSVSAVVVVVASPVAVDAASVSAGKLLRRAAVPRRAIERRRILVGAVDTIRVAIADPLARNALSFAWFIKSFRNFVKKNPFQEFESAQSFVRTPLFVGAAGEFRFSVAFAVAALVSVVFVGIIQTVVISVADVDARNAVAIVAGKEVAETSFGARFTVIWRFIGS